MANFYTEGLRRDAPNWSLAGDKQLLDVLQGLHQKIIEKCQETNRTLEKMVTELDEASIHLQNVNNKFTALSNSQFIESRVFDDDAEDLAEEEKPKEHQETKHDPELENLKHSLQVLDEFHETVTILCDSDSDMTDDDDEDIARVVLKPKDVYADRPLPYIIGSKAWKAKWHAGLLPDESDSDSASIKNARNSEVYSDSDPGISDSPQHLTKPRHSPSISSSSDLETEQPAPPRSQSDVAAELARRLGGTLPQLPDPEPAPAPTLPSPTVRKLYKPHQPTPGNVFLDEPPPLDSDHSEDTDDDIFAEINKKQPYNQSAKRESSVADDLFGRPVFDEVPPLNPPAKQNQPLFEDESEPELFVSKPKPVQEPRKEQDTVKKPAGGMSLFGSSANAESIGAAILKRNQPQSSTSGEDTDQEPTEIKNSTTKNNVVEQQKTDRSQIDKKRGVKTQKEKERDIFEDLFAKSERINKEKNVNNVIEEKYNKEQIIHRKQEKKPDLFSDNIFDDIDDIFTTNIKVESKDDKKEKQSIFDDDNLFADVNKNDSLKVDDKNTKDIFNNDEDADIFNDKLSEIKREFTDNIKDNSIKETKSLFDDSDDDLFSDLDKTKINKNVMKSERDVVSKNEKSANVKKGLFSDDDDLFEEANTNTHSSDKRNMFQETPKSVTDKGKVNVNTTITEPSKMIKSPDLFDDDDDDGMFLFQSTQIKTKPKHDNENKLSENSDNLFENKFVEAKDIKQERTSPDIGTVNLNEENRMHTSTKATSSIFGDEDTKDDIFSKTVTSGKEDLNNFQHSKEVNVNKTTNIGDVNSDKGETNIFDKPDQTIIDTTVTTSKPNISEKPVTVINTKITVNPNFEKEAFTSQDVTTLDTTVVDTKITVTPESTSEPVTVPDVIVKETKVTIKPGIAQKPSVPKTAQPEQLPDKTNVATVLDNMKDVDANRNETASIFDDFNTEKELSTNEEKSRDCADTKTDIFSDIFNDQPPVFEKPKEPKRSKNVNALFDDDSDDESLFFKKNDIISDERPEGFISNDERLFGLFRDEPPAIDVDFEQKSNKIERVPKSDENASHIDEISSQIDQSCIKISEEVRCAGKYIDNVSKTDDNVILSIKDENMDSKNSDIFAPSDDTTQTVTNDFNRDSNKDLFSNITEDIFMTPSVEDDDIFETPEKGLSKNNVSEKSEIEDRGISNKTTVETKKIGKLKPMNFNINVNTLLPGASPKKVAKTNDDTDGQVPSKSNEELYTNDTIIKDNEYESKLVKSTSFDGNPDSSVLDNKLSKERAKIQVKRRPSTRRARREAVKKSGIDFRDDSTDNSSSIDDQPKDPKPSNTDQVAAKDQTVESQKDNSITPEIDIVIPNIGQDITDTIINEVDITENTNKEQGIDIEKQTSISSETYTFGSDDLTYFEDIKVEINNDTTKEQKDEQKPTTEPKTTTEGKEVKSKVVYILNDEDIFNTKANQQSKAQEPSCTENKINTESVFDDIFESIDKNDNKSDGITTLGQVYKESKIKTTKLDFLSDSDDDNLFKTSTTTKVTHVEKKPVAKDSHVEAKNVTLTSKSNKSSEDVDDDLFMHKIDGKDVHKPSLFGSDSDEELFSGVKKGTEVIQKPDTKNEEIRREIKKVSLFEDEDDGGDLFGVKKQKTLDSNPQSSKRKGTKEVISKPTELVFEDPLSLLGSDQE